MNVAAGTPGQKKGSDKRLSRKDKGSSKNLKGSKDADNQPQPMMNPMAGLMMGFPMQSPSMDRQEKRKLVSEIKEELKALITQISDYQVEQAVTIVKA